MLHSRLRFLVFSVFIESVILFFIFIETLFIWRGICHYKFQLKRQHFTFNISFKINWFILGSNSKSYFFFKEIFWMFKALKRKFQRIFVIKICESIISIIKKIITYEDHIWMIMHLNINLCVICLIHWNNIGRNISIFWSFLCWSHLMIQCIPV